MKIFYIENGKERVFVQLKDLIYLKRHKRTPEEVRKFISTCNLSQINVDEFYEFDNKDLIKYLKDSYFILDINKFNNFTTEEIKKEYFINEMNIKKVKTEKKKLPLNERKYSTGLDDALDDLEYYKKNIKAYLRQKEANLRYINM